MLPCGNPQLSNQANHYSTVSHRRPEPAPPWNLHRDNESMHQIPSPPLQHFTRKHEPVAAPASVHVGTAPSRSHHERRTTWSRTSASMKPFRSQSVRESLVWREKVHSATCQLLIAQSYWSTGQLVKAAVNSDQLWSNSGQYCKNGQTREAKLEIGQKLSC